MSDKRNVIDTSTEVPESYGYVDSIIGETSTEDCYKGKHFTTTKTDYNITFDVKYDNIPYVITAEDPEGLDIEVFYKGRKLSNIWAVVFNNKSMMFADEKKSPRERVLDGLKNYK